VNKNFLTATIVGAVVLFVTGYLIFELALGGFYEANMGTATNVMKETPNWMWLIVSILLWSAFLTLALGWAGSTDPASGFKTAAIVSLLVAASYSLGQLGMTNLNTLTLAIADPIAGAIHSGIGGAVIGMLLGKGSNV
jgi:uncharacterized membrane protein